nr:hypothetical protein [Tanacetum cinerariifolium]
MIAQQNQPKPQLRPESNAQNIRMRLLTDCSDNSEANIEIVRQSLSTKDEETKYVHTEDINGHVSTYSFQL